MWRLRQPITGLVCLMGLWGSTVGVVRAQEAAAGEQAAPADVTAEEAPLDDKLITMNFQDVDLGVLVKFISEITHRNFIIDEKVKGKVTIISPAKISVDEAYLVFQSVLQVKGFTTVPSGSVIKIVPTKEAKSSTLRTIVPRGGVSPSDEFITRLVPLKHVDANNMVAIMQPMVSPDGLLAAYAATNTLIIIDTAAQTARLVKILGELDVEGHESQIEVIRLNYAFAGEVAQTLAQVLDDSQSQAQQPRAAPAPAPATGTGRAARTGAAAGQAVSGGAPGKSYKIIPDERTNSLIALAGVLEMRRIKDVVARLDVPLPLGASRIHVYYLKYANAVELLGVLSTMVSGGGAALAIGATAGRRAGLGGLGGLAGGRGLGGLAGVGGFDGGLGAGLAGSRFGARRGALAGAALAGDGITSGQPGPLGGTPLISGQPFGAAIGGQQVEAIRMTADPQTNAIIINASPQDYETIKEVIEKLDVRRRQVFVEAIILEVRLEKALALGFDFQGGTALGNSAIGIGRTNLSGNLNTLFAAPSSLQGLALAALSNQTIRLPNGQVVPAQAALFTALQNDNDVNILSAPNILTTDNQEAEIVVGQNVPFVASRSTSETNLANQFNTIERRDVGITLRLTPQISEGGSVRLDLFQEVSAIVSAANDPTTIALGPTTTIRSATTTVVARDGQTIVIGGLISDGQDNMRSRVPFFGDIPVLGNLFKYSTSNRQKINLLLFLTPHIVRNEADQRKISTEQRDRVQAFMEENKIPGRHRDVLDAPSWDVLPPPAKGGEKGDGTEPESDDRPATDQVPEEPLATAPPPLFVLLAAYWQSGEAPPVLTSSSGLLPLALPDDSPIRKLFVPGRDVRFESHVYSALFHVLEAYPTEPAAKLVYPEGLTVSSEPREVLHWRDVSSDTSARNAASWTRVD